MGAGHGHQHSHGQDPDLPLGRGTTGVLLAVLGVILVATVAGAVLLWPGPPPPVKQSTAAASADVHTAKVVSAAISTCPATSEDRLPDGSIPASASCASAVATIGARRITVSVPPQVFRAGIAPGDRIEVANYQGVWTWVDFSRGLPLGILAAVFAALVIGVARLRGLAAIGGLALAFLAIVRFTLPALRDGESAVLVALVTSVAVMTVVLYLAHGFSMKTTTALLGTVFGLVLTSSLAWWAVSSAHLNGLSSEENFTLTQLTGTSDLSGIILCGIIIAGLGVLNDVTVTQASAVWEVHAHATDLGVAGLFRSGMRVGRDHLASTVYTIAFAYAGAALPTLILIDLYARPVDQVLTSGGIAEEIVRTLVGSIGLILAIPVTTLIAAVTVASGRRVPEHNAGHGRRRA